jgi:hypothetical protein
LPFDGTVATFADVRFWGAAGLMWVAWGLACADRSTPCPDCCMPGESALQDVQVQCRVTLPDSGVARGVVAQCISTDAGSVTDDAGMFSFPVVEEFCGVAKGSVDCGALQLMQEGKVLRFSGQGLEGGHVQMDSARMTRGACRLLVVD